MLTGSFAGAWWLPDQPDRRVAGTLEVGWDLLRLDLIGSFLDPPQWSQVQRHPVILGTTTDGKRVTLHENVVAAISFNLAAYGLPAVAIRPTVAFVGGHLAEPSAAKFKGITLDLERFTDWLQPRPMNVEVEDGRSTDGQPVRRAHVSYESPPVEEQQLTDTTLKIGMSWGVKGDRTSETVIWQRASLDATHSDGLTSDEWHEALVGPLRNLLSLATERPITVERLELRESADPTEGGGLEVVGPRAAPRPDPPRMLLPPEMVFGLHELPAEGLARWITLSRELGDALNLFFGVRYAPGMYVENEFLNLAQGVEVYHRRRHGGTEASAPDHDARLSGILEATPTRYRPWLAEKLRHSNELTLSQRLKELYRAVGPVMQPLLGDGKTWVWRVVEARNFQTHRDAAAQKGIPRGVDLWWLAQELSVLMTALLLLELGFTTDQTGELLRRGSPAYQRLLGRRLADATSEPAANPSPRQGNPGPVAAGDDPNVHP